MSPEQKERLYTLMREMYDKLGDDIDDLVILAEINEQARFAMDRIWAEERLSSCLLYTSPSPRDLSTSRMPSSA